MLTPKEILTVAENHKAERPFAAEPWLGLLEDILGVSIADKLDSIDIEWDGLDAALKKLPARYVEVLRLRYVEKLTLKEVGKKIGDVSATEARRIEQKSLRILRHPKHMRTIKSCIAGHWRLYVPPMRDWLLNTDGLKYT